MSFTQFFWLCVLLYLGLRLGRPTKPLRQDLKDTGRAWLRLVRRR